MASHSNHIHDSIHSGLISHFRFQIPATLQITISEFQTNRKQNSNGPPFCVIVSSPLSSVSKLLNSLSLSLYTKEPPVRVCVCLCIT